MSDQPPDPDTCSSCGSQFPAGQVCANCFPALENPPPDLESIFRASQGFGPDVDGAIRTMASIHAQWRAAWTETGKFSEQESFELVRIIVASSSGGVRCLNL